MSVRRICASGIAETLGQNEVGRSVNKTLRADSAPSSLDLKKARRLALKKRISYACNECKRVKRKCGELRPCGRCISLGLNQSCDAPQGDADPQSHNVERPIAYNVTALHFRRSAPFPDGHLKYQWSSTIIRSFWEIGYKYSAFVEMFNALPSNLSSSIVNMLGTIAPLQCGSALPCRVAASFAFIPSSRADRRPPMPQPPLRQPRDPLAGGRRGRLKAEGADAAGGEPMGGG